MGMSVFLSVLAWMKGGELGSREKREKREKRERRETLRGKLRLVNKEVHWFIGSKTISNVSPYLFSLFSSYLKKKTEISKRLEASRKVQS